MKLRIRRHRRAIVILATVAVLVVSIAIGMVSGPASERPMHYTPNGNFDSHNRYLPAAAGFSVADVSSVDQMNALPPSVQGMAWIGLCHGADAAFIAAVRPYIGNPKLYGFYLMDDPDPRVPTGKSAPLCKASDLKAESDWIHANAHGAKTFIALMNVSSSRTPSYADTYNPRNTNIDLFGISPYPCRSELQGCDYQMIDRYVAAAVAAGIPLKRLVPIYQAFGGGKWKDDGGGIYLLPSPEQEEAILARWATLIRRPAFDFAYSWGSQQQDMALGNSPELQAVFRRHYGVDSGQSAPKYDVDTD